MPSMLIHNLTDRQLQFYLSHSSTAKLLVELLPMIPLETHIALLDGVFFSQYSKVPCCGTNSSRQWCEVIVTGMSATTDVFCRLLSPMLLSLLQRVHLSVVCLCACLLHVFDKPRPFLS
jgi:hypothetical protein